MIDLIGRISATAAVIGAAIAAVTMFHYVYCTPSGEEPRHLHIFCFGAGLGLLGVGLFVGFIAIIWK